MMLPAVPKTIGRLSEVLSSAIAAVDGRTNSLQLAKAKNACVILVDGLGSKNLQNRAGHAPRLSRQLEKDGSILCGFPSTTATSLVSLATGTMGGQHGVIGYEIFDRQSGQTLNHLTGLSDEQIAAKYQTQKSLAEISEASGASTFFIGAPEYENSAFTRITLPTAKYVAAKSIEERFDAASRLLRDKSGAVIYLYISELDSKAHAFGVDSPEWIEQLELLESQVSKFVATCASDCGVLLTADHGVIDVEYEKQIFLDQFNFDENLVNVSGDPRVNFLYFAKGPASNLQEELSAWLRKRAYVVTRNQMIESGWYGQVSAEVALRMPDLFVVARGETALYHRKFAKPHSLKMIGQHGAIDEVELTIPLLRFGKFAILQK